MTSIFFERRGGHWSEPDQPANPVLLTVSRGKIARFLYRCRRLRPGEIEALPFGEPIWDMLLDLYIQADAQKRVSVKSLCIASHVPATTALRYIKNLEAQGWFVREADGHDNRRDYIKLSTKATQAMNAYLDMVSATMIDIIPNATMEVKLSDIDALRREIQALSRDLEQVKAGERK